MLYPLSYEGGVGEDLEANYRSSCGCTAQSRYALPPCGSYCR
jgi:hypothetical protein